MEQLKAQLGLHRSNMVQVLERNPSFGSQIGRSLGEGLGSAFGNAIGGGVQGYQDKKNSDKFARAFKERTGMDLSEYPPEIQQEFAKQFSKYQAQEQMFNRMFPSKGGNQGGIGKDLMKGGGEGQSEAGMDSEGVDLTNLDQQDRMKLAMLNPALGRQAVEEEKLKHKKSETEIARGYEESKPTRARGRQLIESLPQKEMALETMKNAIQSNNLGAFSLDNLAELTGIEGLRTPEGAAFKTASKEYFLGNLGRIGAKGLNQMMEKVVMEMSPLIGRKKEANLAVAEILEAENDVARKEAELINSIGNNFKEKNGHYPDDLEHLVYKQLHPYAVERQKETLKKIDQIKEKYEPKNKGGVLMYDPSGNLRRVPHADIKNAEKEGYRKG